MNTAYCTGFNRDVGGLARNLLATLFAALGWCSMSRAPGPLRAALLGAPATKRSDERLAKAVSREERRPTYARPLILLPRIDDDGTDRIQQAYVRAVAVRRRPRVFEPGLSSQTRDITWLSSGRSVRVLVGERVRIDDWDSRRMRFVPSRLTSPASLNGRFRDVSPTPPDPSQTPAPTWSADGWVEAFTVDTKGVYTAAVGRGASARLVVPLGRVLHSLRYSRSTGNHRILGDLALSPNGKWLAFVVDDPNPRRPGEDIWIVQVDGSGLQRLGPGFPLLWSPDDSRLLTGITEGDDPNQLLLYDVDRPRTRPRILWRPDRGLITSVASVAFSPDGKYIATLGPLAELSELSRPWGIFLIDLKGHEVERLAAFLDMGPTAFPKLVW